MNNRNTTVAGIGAIIAAVGGIISTWPNVEWATAVAAIMAGLGLVFAKDAKKADA